MSTSVSTPIISENFQKNLIIFPKKKSSTSEHSHPIRKGVAKEIQRTVNGLFL